MSVHTLCKVVERQTLAPTLISLVFDCSEVAGAVRAGQFLHVACGDGLLLRRPISVCDVDGSLVKLVFEVKGQGTRWLSERKLGDTLDILGPLGNGFDLSEKKLLLAGGGIGVPPMLMVARQATSSTAVLGFATAAKAALLPEFAVACEAVDISTDDGSLGKHGFLTELVQRRLDTEHFDAVLACGPAKMLARVAQIAADHNTPCQVSLEERMGCGVGACLVCSCKVKTSYGEGYARVCADGPVFSSEEVIWDEA